MHQGNNGNDFQTFLMQFWDRLEGECSPADWKKVYSNATEYYQLCKDIEREVQLLVNVGGQMLVIQQLTMAAGGGFVAMPVSLMEAIFAMRSSLMEDNTDHDAYYKSACAAINSHIELRAKETRCSDTVEHLQQLGQYLYACQDPCHDACPSVGGVGSKVSSMRLRGALQELSKHNKRVQSSDASTVTSSSMCQTSSSSSATVATAASTSHLAASPLSCANVHVGDVELTSENFEHNIVFARTMSELMVKLSNRHGVSPAVCYRVIRALQAYSQGPGSIVHAFDRFLKSKHIGLLRDLRFLRRDSEPNSTFVKADLDTGAVMQHMRVPYVLDVTGSAKCSYTVQDERDLVAADVGVVGAITVAFEHRSVETMRSQGLPCGTEFGHWALMPASVEMTQHRGSADLHACLLGDRGEVRVPQAIISSVAGVLDSSENTEELKKLGLNNQSTPEEALSVFTKVVEECVASLEKLLFDLRNGNVQDVDLENDDINKRLGLDKYDVVVKLMRGKCPLQDRESMIGNVAKLLARIKHLCRTMQVDSSSDNCSVVDHDNDQSRHHGADLSRYRYERLFQDHLRQLMQQLSQLVAVSEKQFAGHSLCADAAPAEEMQRLRRRLFAMVLKRAAQHPTDDPSSKLDAVVRLASKIPLPRSGATIGLQSVLNANPPTDSGPGSSSSSATPASEAPRGGLQSDLNATEPAKDMLFRTKAQDDLWCPRPANQTIGLQSVLNATRSQGQQNTNNEDASSGDDCNDAPSPGAPS